jgi:hypothetical protein
VSSIDQLVGDSAADYADSALAFIASEIPAIDTVSVMLNQRARANGDPYDVMDIGFTIPPAQGVFYCHPDAAKDWPKLALHEITLKANKVLSIYAGYTEREDVIPLIDPQPTDYPGDVLPVPPPPPPEAV